MIRIGSHELKLNERNQYLWQNEPFTGTSLEHDNEGRLSCEKAYLEGQQAGPVRIWQPVTGQLLAEFHYDGGLPHGLHREWHEKLTQHEIARLKSEREYIQGVLLSSRCWDRDGQLQPVSEPTDEGLSQTLLDPPGQPETALRVAACELQFTPEYLFEYQGEPFTGLAYELNAGRDGREQLSCEVSYQQGMRHGLYREWHEQGALRTEIIYEYGIRLSERNWLPDGDLAEESQLQPGDFHYQLLLRRRRRYGP